MVRSGEVWGSVENTKQTKTYSNKDKSWQCRLQSASIDAVFSALSRYINPASFPAAGIEGHGLKSEGI